MYFPFSMPLPWVYGYTFPGFVRVAPRLQERYIQAYNAYTVRTL